MESVYVVFISRNSHLAMNCTQVNLIASFFVSLLHQRACRYVFIFAQYEDVYFH